MPTTARIGIPFPAENQDPFYDAFVRMVNAIDTSLYAGREDRHLVFSGGGTFTFLVDVGSNVASLSWTGTISIAAAITGFQWGINPSSINLNDGDAVYVSITRAPLRNIAVIAVKGQQVPSTDEALLIALRRGNKIYFRNGRVMGSGQSFDVLDASSEVPPSFGEEGQALRLRTPIAITRNTAVSSVPVVAGTCQFAANDFPITPTTLTTNFRACAFATGSATGEIQLFDLTTFAPVLTYTFSSGTPSEQVSSFSMSPTAHTYEVRMRVSGGSGSVFLQWAAVEAVNAF